MLRSLMRLESVTLHGFKSFAERTEVKVLPGITCIVGPNGAGKSNISEAVRWALGEQSAKTLRGQRMEDVIFHGSASRKAVGLAEVELTFSNDGTLAVPWSEIAVARRLYRTGESEYLLNRQPARLRDILDLFAGTGANPRAYSIMDQDKLNHVLTAKPHERRIFIEEAAGIARYKQQRHETQGKLDAARQNLLRVKDVMDEVRRQLGSLERQARRAQQYKALEQERRQAALQVAAADLAVLESELAHLEGEVAERRARESGLRAEASRLAGRQATQRQALQESDHRLSDLRQSVQKVQAELERLLERREQMGVQLREAVEEGARLADEIRVAEERLAALGGEREATRAALADAERQASERGAAAAGLEEAVGRHRAGLAEERERLEALRLEQIRVAGERTDLMRSAEAAGRAHTGESGVHHLRLGDQDYTVTYLFLGEKEKPWENLILVGLNRRELDHTLTTLKLVIFGVGLAAGLVGAFLSVWLSMGMRRQIAFLTEGTRQAALDKLPGDIPVTSQDELGELAESFNAMIRALREKTRQLQEERDRIAANADFLSMIVHDIKAPLTGLRLSIELLDDMTLPPETHQKLKGIIQRSEGLLLHLHNVLYLSRFESGLLALRPEVVPPAFLVQRLLHHFSPLAQSQGVAMSSALPQDLPPVKVDEPSLERVLANLLVNALEATPPGGAITVQGGVLAGGNHPEVELVVADTGRGIPSEEQQVLFEKYRQHHHHGNGSGLGLYICKTLIEANGGRIWVESKPGCGASFHLALPAAAQTGPERQGPDPPLNPAGGEENGSPL